jgi:tetratricopeptide (TPR) repeat protein
MASVFLSYDHEDAARAAPIAAALEAQGHSVWWDRHIQGGAEYNNAIETAVDAADAMVVLWSSNSVRSAWVRDEAAEGRDAGKLVPVLIEPVKPPMGFRQYQTVDLAAWNGGKRIPQLPQLLHAIERLAASGSPRQKKAPPPSERKPAATPRPPPDRMSRRALIGGGTAAAVALAAGGLWWSGQRARDPQLEGLLDKVREAIGHQSIDGQTVRIAEAAVALQPGSAKALGLLALVKSLLAQEGDASAVAASVSAAERAARRALAIDPKEPNALLAMFELQGTSLDWFERDQRLRRILAIDPSNVGAMSEIILLLQATGYVQESWEWNERVLALEPLSPDFLGRRAFKLWIRGRVAEADKVSDQLRSIYPADPWAWYVRFKIYAYTGRAKAALAMLDGNPEINGRPPLAHYWRAALEALDQPSAINLARARTASLAGAQTSAQLATEAVQAMSALRQIDAAFDIANGLLLSRGPIVLHDSAALAAFDAGWRIGTQWMFTPPAVPMWRDARFLPLCEGIGLADYWRRRGVRPDFQRA